MKRVVLSLAIAGLIISGDCFAMNDVVQSNEEGHFQKLKTEAIKVSKRADVKVVAGTIGTIGAAVAAYHFVPGAFGLVKSGAIGAVKNSKIGNVVKSWLDVANLKAKDTVKSWLGIKPIAKKSLFDKVKFCVGFILGKTVTEIVALSSFYIVPSAVHICGMLLLGSLNWLFVA